MITTLALDLEGTLVSNAVSQFPRPGLCAFLTWAIDRFPRVVLFTAVRRRIANGVIDTLIQDGFAPSDLSDRLGWVEWSGPHKDLRFINGTTPEETLIVDDMEGFILSDQKSQWISIAPYDPRDDDNDSELARVCEVIERRIAHDDTM